MRVKKKYMPNPVKTYVVTLKDGSNYKVFATSKKEALGDYKWDNGDDGNLKSILMERNKSISGNNVFKKASDYRKQHPRTSFQDAIKKVSGTKVSGTKKIGAVKKKVSGTRKMGSVKTKMSGTPKRKVSGTGAIGGFAKARAISGKIGSLETKRKKLTKKIERDIIQLEINAEHRKLDALMRQLKRA